MKFYRFNLNKSLFLLISIFYLPLGHASPEGHTGRAVLPNEIWNEIFLFSDPSSYSTLRKADRMLNAIAADTLLESKWIERVLLPYKDLRDSLLSLETLDWKKEERTFFYKMKIIPCTYEQRAIFGIFRQSLQAAAAAMQGVNQSLDVGFDQADIVRPDAPPVPLVLGVRRCGMVPPHVKVYLISPEADIATTDFLLRFNKEVDFQLLRLVHSWHRFEIIN
jgi:hypothetical protein